VKLPRLLLFSALLAFLPGCIGYTKFRATNRRGEMIAEWTGRGLFYPVSGGYRINAVERVSGPPLMHVTRYPHGFRTTVTGAHIERWHTYEPAWLENLRDYDDPAAKHPPRPVSEY